MCNTYLTGGEAEMKALGVSGVSEDVWHVHSCLLGYQPQPQQVSVKRLSLYSLVDGGEGREEGEKERRKGGRGEGRREGDKGVTRRIGRR